MKIAIKPNRKRGKDIINLLKSLGGVNKYNWKGDSFGEYLARGYFIEDNYIQFDTIPNDYKVYTIEEFEKEFPFKVGDEVVWDKDNYTAVRTVLRIDYSDLAGIKYAITAFGAENCFWEVDVNELKPYKEMKEERNIKLTLEKAKEWYKKGGDLKQVALQAFSEEELNSLPRSWEEFCKNGYWHIGYPEKYKALFKLEKLRDCWRQGWKPKEHGPVYTIKFSVRGLSVYEFCSREFLSFKDRETAIEFLKCFRDLIEKAGDLI